jgi:hypothetical protein
MELHKIWSQDDRNLHRAHPAPGLGWGRPERARLPPESGEPGGEPGVREEQRSWRAGQPVFLSWSLKRTLWKPPGNASGIRAAAQFIRLRGNLKPLVSLCQRVPDRKAATTNYSLRPRVLEARLSNLMILISTSTVAEPFHSINLIIFLVAFY